MRLRYVAQQLRPPPRRFRSLTFVPHPLLQAAWVLVGASESVAAPGQPRPSNAALPSDGAGDEIPWKLLLSSKPVWALSLAHAASNFFLYFGVQTSPSSPPRPPLPQPTLTTTATTTHYHLHPPPTHTSNYVTLALAWLPIYFSYTFGLDASASAAASEAPFAAGAVGGIAAGIVCDKLAAQTGSLTRARKLTQSVAFVGPAVGLLTLAWMGEGGTLTREGAELIFTASVGCQSFSAAGFGCASQDISTRYAALLYGTTSVLGVAAGATAQVGTGIALEVFDRDFAPVFGVTALVEFLGLAAWWLWWSSDERIFE